MNLKNFNINNSWTLFLDRDGVINQRIINDYVKNIDEFVFIQGSDLAISILNSIFKYTFVVTNQQCIGKGIITPKQLEIVHQHMKTQIETIGGKIDKIYLSPYLAHENHNTRKPNPGMGLLAKEEYKDIDFDKSIMVGDSISDLLFGRNLKMKTVFISNDIDKIKENMPNIDLVFPSLIHFANALKEQT